MRSFTYIFLFFGSYLFGLRHCPFYALHLPLPHFTVIKGANLRHIVFPYSARDCGQMSVFGWEVSAQRHGPSESDGIRLDYGHDPPTHSPSGSPLTKRLHVEEIPVVRQLEPEILVRKRKNMWWKNLPFVWKIQTLVIVVFYSFFLIILRNRWRNKLEKKDLEYSLWLKLFVICIFCLNFFDVQNWLSLGKSRVA